MQPGPQDEPPNSYVFSAMGVQVTDASISQSKEEEKQREKNIYVYFCFIFPMRFYRFLVQGQLLMAEVMDQIRSEWFNLMNHKYNAV